MNLGKTESVSAGSVALSRTVNAWTKVRQNTTWLSGQYPVYPNRVDTHEMAILTMYYVS
jgi:hypothetical protein